MKGVFNMKTIDDIKKKFAGTGDMTFKEKEVFQKLIKFMEDPKNNKFEINELYNSLANDDLTFALKMINQFFSQETYLISKNSTLFLDGLESDTPYSTSELYNISNAVKLLNESGLNFYKQKITTYLERGKFPQPDLIVSNKKFWSTDTLKKYIAENQNTTDK